MTYAVITRHPDGIEPYASALAPMGIDVIAMPVTRIEPPRDTRALPRALATGGHVAVVVASARAATALIAALREIASGEHARSEHAVIPEAPVPGIATTLPPIWAVGPATAKVLEDAGIVANVPATASDATTLAEAIISSQQLHGRRVLVPRAEGGRDEGIEILRSAGAIIDDVIAYRSVVVASDEPLVRRGRPLLADATNFCIVFAPSQVAALHSIVPLTGVLAAFAAIGETTAQALRDHGVHPAAVAGSPTPEGIAKAVAAVYPRRR